MIFTDTQNESIISQVQKIQPQNGELVMLLFGEKSDTDYLQLIAALNSLGISFFGGVFPGIIYQEEKYEKGYILKKFPGKNQAFIIQGLNTGEITTKDHDKLLSLAEEDHTLITFVDGLTPNISNYLSYLYNYFGSNSSFIGGGAGSISLKKQPCVFSNEGFFQDAAVLAMIDLKVSLGVQHGWKKLFGPIVATRTYKNKIYELNWENAFDVYCETVNKDSAVPITKDNFFAVAKGYPFGIFKENGEDIVRDPLHVGKSGAITCIADVPENTILYILKGSKNKLIEAAQLATEQCIVKTPGNFEETLMINCISRALFLDGKFNLELKAINGAIQKKKNNIAPYGILSLGEISSHGEGYLEFYNKTLVIGILY